MLRELSIEIYISIIATLFTILGIWVVLKIVNKKNQTDHESETLDEDMVKKLKISKREYDVLKLMAKGFSNQEIADALFISLTTVKTHSTNIFQKLDVDRRTQAVHKAKSLHIIM